VVERLCVGHRCLNNHYYWRLILDKNGDRARPFRKISGTLEMEGQGECCGYSKVFYVVAPVCVG
jgi:hypothetical protein